MVNGDCKLLLDYNDEDPEPPYREVKPMEVSRLGRALLGSCVNGGGPGQGGKVEPVDANGDATLWLLHADEEPHVIYRNVTSVGSSI